MVAIGGQRIGRTNIIFCEEIGTELQVVIQVKGATSLKAQAESRDSGRLGQFPHALHTTELALGVLRGSPGSSPTTAVVVVGLHVSIDSMALLVVLLLVVLLVVTVEVCRGHGCRDSRLAWVNKTRRMRERTQGRGMND